MKAICNKSYGYLKSAERYNFQEWNLENNGFKDSSKIQDNIQVLQVKVTLLW